MIALLMLALPLYQAPAANPCANGYTENIWDSRFTPGQRWSYHARAIDRGSTLTVTKIDYVPDIGTVVQVTVDHVDFEDLSGQRPMNANRNEYLAFRRDSLDASVIGVLGIVQIAGTPSNYHLWQDNCNGLTFATTVADTLQMLQDQHLAKERTATFPLLLSLAGKPSAKPEKFALTLSVQAKPGLPEEIEGLMSAPDGHSVKGATIELRTPDASHAAIVVKTNDDGKFRIPLLGPGSYGFRLTMEDFQSIVGILNVSFHRPQLTNLRPGG